MWWDRDRNQCLRDSNNPMLYVCRRDSRHKQWRDLFSVVCKSTDTPLPMWRLRRIVGRTVRTRAASEGLLDGSSPCLLALTELVTMGRQVAWFTVCDGNDNAIMCKIHHTEAFIVCECRRVSQAHEFDAFEAFEPATMFIVLARIAAEKGPPGLTLHSQHNRTLPQ
jgi:hypothetical protein